MSMQSVSLERTKAQSMAAEARTSVGSRLLFVDNIRVFLTVLVILHHLMIIYAGTNGYLDDLEVEDCLPFERELYKYLDTQGRELMQELAAKGSTLVICQTCLDYFHLREVVRVGTIGGMGDIVAAMSGADKVISV